MSAAVIERSQLTGLPMMNTGVRKSRRVNELKIIVVLLFVLLLSQHLIRLSSLALLLIVDLRNHQSSISDT